MFPGYLDVANQPYTAPTTPAAPPKFQKIPTRERNELVAFGSFLSFAAGYINGITLFGSFGTAVSHVTGSSSWIGIQAAEGQWGLAGLYGALVLAFMGGGVVAAAVVGEQGFRWSRRYGWVLVLEAVFLVFAYLDLHHAFSRHTAVSRGSVWAAFACGLQNAITTTFSGAVIRTTHTTGLVSDIGIVIGQALFHPDAGRTQLWKLSVLVPLWVAFVAGGFAAVFGVRWIGESSLLLLALVLGLLGVVQIAYRGWRAYLRRQRRLRELEAVRAYADVYSDEVEEPVEST